MRRRVLGSVAVTLLLACGPAVERPNVLILLWDTVRADRLVPYGYERPTTPQLAALAAESVVFERAVSPGIWTPPSHASLFTGLPVRSHGVEGADLWLDERFETLAEQFANAGYATYAFSANPHVSWKSNLLQGFERVEYAWDEPWRTAVRAHMTALVPGHDRSTEVSPAYEVRGRDRPREADFVKEAGPAAGDALLAWLDRRATDAPFFAYLGFMEAHIPRIPSEAARRRFLTPDAVARSYRLDRTHTRQLLHTFEVERYSAQDLEILSGVYDAALRDLDEATGRLLEKLRGRGILDRTIVVLTSDHGEHLGEHDRIGHRYSVYNPLSRVPLLIRYPGELAPDRVPEPVSIAGIASTLRGLAGIEPVSPDSLLERPSNEGVAVTELTRIGPAALRHVTRLYAVPRPQRWSHTYRAIEAGRWKLIERSDGRRELFDVAHDVGEQHDVADENAGALGALAERIEAWNTAHVPYDPSLRSEDEHPRRARHAFRRQLEALGYVEAPSPTSSEDP